MGFFYFFSPNIKGPNIIATIAPTPTLSNIKRVNESVGGDIIKYPTSAISPPMIPPRIPNFHILVDLSNFIPSKYRFYLHRLILTKIDSEPI